MNEDLKKTDLAPRGVPPWLTLVVYMVGYMVSGVMIQNIVPCADLMQNSGVLANSGLDEEKIHDTIVHALNLGLSLALFSCAIIQIIVSMVGGLNLLAILWVVSHAGGLLIAFSAGSNFALLFGIGLSSLAFPISNLLMSVVIHCLPIFS
eukprot:GHVH01006953.1.p1 GENE.GHVH01006953.1~~GHVH01006953.1.p1  ORF type:complete len:150 (+),score=23.09 GHVH01006953.1:37-486(+)